MATIKLSGGFQRHPEGNFDFQIIEVDESSLKYNKLIVKLADAQKKEINQKFDLSVDGGLTAFSILTKAALQDWDIEEITDPQELVGKFINANVVHTSSTGDDGKQRVFVNLRDIQECDGFKSSNTVSQQPVVPDLSFLNN